VGLPRDEFAGILGGPGRALRADGSGFVANRALRGMVAMIKKALFALALLAATVCQAQFIGFVSQQSVTSTPFPAGTTCTAALAAGPVIVPNIGQSAHFVTAFPSTSVISLIYTIQGSYDGTTFFDISDQGTGTLNTVALTGVNGSGYYPAVAVRVSNCTPGTATLSVRYSGISMTPGTPAGTNQQGQYVKNVAIQAPAGALFSSFVMRSPFGSSGGTLQFIYSAGTPPTGSSLSVGCGTDTANILQQFGPFPLQATATVQAVPIPAVACAWFVVIYNSGGASSVFFNLDYSFNSVVAPADPCENYPKVSAAVIAGAAATTQIPLAGTVVLASYVCGYQVSAAAAATMQWQLGVGACGTGTISLSGPMSMLASTPFSFSGPGTVMKVPVGDVLCLVTTGVGGSVAGLLDYAQAP
jgi:hypothetical protein